MSTVTPEIVLGPPGTGKTTTLLGYVEQELAQGTPPDRIGYVSFTRQAAEEAVSRAVEKFSVDRADFKYFRTLHSLCYHALGMTRNEVMEDKRLQDFARYARVRITGRWSDDGTFNGFQTGDRMLFMTNLARLRMIPLSVQYQENPDNLPWNQLELFATSLERFKVENGVKDYTDMLIEFAQLGWSPQLDVLFVDEAQDLSAAQWAVVRKLARTARRVVIAGDDDQAIYRWAGADVEALIGMEGAVRVLGRSWRVPPSVQSVADSIISRVRHRRPKEWAPRDGEDGGVDRSMSFDAAQLYEYGTVLVLVRNNFLINRVVEPALRDRGELFEVYGRPSIALSMTSAVRDWEALRRGDPVTVGQARAIYKQMSSGRGVKRGFKELPGEWTQDDPVTMRDLADHGGLLIDTPWFDALDRIPPVDVQYLRTILRRGGGRLGAKPRIRVSTIHGSKGGEADHVVLLRDMATRTHNEMNYNQEDEARVWYVASTRAKHRLTVVEAQAGNPRYPNV